MGSNGLAALIKRRLAGLAFLVVVLLLVGFCIGAYAKVFTPVKHLTLMADRAGNQMQQGADVKVRGVIVGEVRNITSTGHGAKLSLAIKPDDLNLIPADATARLLPKTLFGQKYVDLQIPRGGGDGVIAAGATIGMDRSKTAIETNKLLDDILPLLQAVPPGKLNQVLYAISSALEGRGDELGATLVKTGDYLSKLNPELPNLRTLMQRLAKTADIYNTAAPDLLRVLNNLPTTSRTLVNQRQQLDKFLTSTTGFADNANTLLSVNGGRLIQLASVSRPLLSLLAKYSPIIPCLSHSLTQLEPRLEKAFGAGTDETGLHLTLEIVKNNGKYVKGQDEPKYADTGAPTCFGLPNPKVPFPQVIAKNGYDYNADRGPLSPKTASDALAGFDSSVTDGSYHGTAAMGYAGTAGEDKEIKLLLGAATKSDPSKVPEVAPLLFGPMVRGTQVVVS